MKRFCLLVLVVFCGQSVLAQTVSQAAPEQYIVKKGDTLWDISKKYLNNPWQWQKIWVANPHIKNPHLIYPKDKLLLCNIGGEMRVGRDDNNKGCAGIAEMASGRLSPRVYESPIEDPIARIALGDIQSWVKQVEVFDRKLLQSAPYVLEMMDMRVLASAGDKLYVRGKNLQVGAKYGIYRPGQPYYDTGKIKQLGWESMLVGRGLVTAVNRDNVATMEVKEAFNSEVRKGDRVIMEPMNTMPSIFEPANNPKLPDGKIVRVVDSVGNATVNSIIALNIGSKQGAQTNNLVAIHRSGIVIRDYRQGDKVRLPNERTGLAMIIRTFDNISYAYVLEATNTLSIGDVVTPAL